MKTKVMAACIGALFQQAVEGAAVGTPGAAAPAAVVAAPAPVSPIPGTQLKSTKYHFKKDELGVKRDTVELAVPLLSDVTVLITKMGEDPKVAALMLELANSMIVSQGREQVNDDKSPVNKQEELDLSKLTIEFIAAIPPAERKGGGISKETWTEFFKDYVETMIAATGKKKEQVENAGKLFVARLQPVKTQKKILDFLKGQLAQWFSTTQAKEEFAEVYEFLDGKITEFMSRDEASLLANL